MRNLCIISFVSAVLVACGGGGSGGSDSGSGANTTPGANQFAVISTDPTASAQIQTVDLITVNFNDAVNANSVYYNSSDSGLDSVRVVDIDRNKNVPIDVLVSGNRIQISAIEGWKGLRVYRLELTQELSSTATTSNALLGGFKLPFSTDIRTVTSDEAKFVICNENYKETDLYEIQFKNLSGSILNTQQFLANAALPVDPLEYPCSKTFDGFVVEPQRLTTTGLASFLATGDEFSAKARYKVYPNLPVVVVGDKRQLPSGLWSGFSGSVDFNFAL